MATYVNDLRLKEITTGDESGTWGTSTNTNLELIAEAFSYGTEVITTNADTHTTTIADGATDPGRALYLKYTGTLDSACTITIGPNTVSKVWIIENGTSGSQDIILSQGSGANITIPAGDTKVVYSDGAGAGAAFFDAFASINVGALTGTSLDISGDIDVDGTTNLDVVDIDGALTQDGGAVFNETGADVDFRVESDTVDHALFVQGSDGFVGIGTNSPVQVLHLGGASNKAIQITSSTSNAGYFGVYQDQAGFSVNRDASNGTFADAGKTEAAIVLQSQNANSFIAFRTTPTNNAEAPERLRIDKDGNVGIGTTSPNQDGFGAESRVLTVKAPTSGGTGALELIGLANSSGDLMSAINFMSYAVTNPAARITALRYTADDEASIAFDTSGAERLRIASDGKVSIGTTSAIGSAILTLQTSANTKMIMRMSTAGAGEYWRQEVDVDNIFYIINQSSTGVYIDNGATSWTAISDENVKENIVELTGALDKVKNYRCVEYNLIADETKTKKIGFIAQDWQEDYSQVVSQDYNGNLGMQYTETIPVLLKAIQEQQVLIESLTARITTLEG
jgi:hypothetical protein